MTLILRRSHDLQTWNKCEQKIFRWNQKPSRAFYSDRQDEMWSLDIFWTLNSEKEYEKYLLSVSQKMIQSLFDERLISFLSEMLIRKPRVLDPCWNFNKIYPFSCSCRESKLFILPLPAKVFTKVHKLLFAKNPIEKRQ